MKKIPICIITSILLMSFVSCHDEIFYNINNEVKLADPTVFGTILSIARATFDEDGDGEKEQYLYLSNGGIMRKNVTEITPKSVQEDSGRWSSFPKPDGGMVIFVATDENCLYALSLGFSENDDGDHELNRRRLYAFDFSGTEKTWKLVKTGAKDLSISGGDKTSVTLFSTNNPIPVNRKAFLNDNGNIYELNGDSAKLIFDKSKVKDKMGTNDKGEPVKVGDDYSDCCLGSYTFSANNLETSSRSAISWGNKIYFHSSSGSYNTGNLITTNEVLENTGRGMTKKAADKLYFLSGSTVYYCDDTSKNPFEKHEDGEDKGKYKSHSLSTSIGSTYAIAYMKDALLVGTSSGIKKITLETDGADAGKPKSVVEKDFMKNASTALNSEYFVPTMLVVDPTKGEEDEGCEVYASTEFDGSSSSTSAQFNRIGLWSYYGERHNWNRE